MVNRANKQRLDSLLQSGAITQKEYEHLLRNIGLENEEEFEEENGEVIEEREENSLAKNVLSFILTILAIIGILFGTCIMNINLVLGMESTVLGVILTVAWPLFPIILFGRRAYKTKNAGMKWAVIVFTLISLCFLVMSMG